MTNIPFIQYLRPNGRKAMVQIDRPDHIAKAADFIRSHQFRFECEELISGQVSLTISDDHGDYTNKLIPNGPEVPKAVDEMILSFDVPQALKLRELFLENT